MREKSFQKNVFLYGDPHTPITGSTGFTKQETKFKLFRGTPTQKRHSDVYGSEPIRIEYFSAKIPSAN